MLAVQMDGEKQIMLDMAEEKAVTIHSTPCTGLRECGEQGDVNNSCHWSVTHRWMCFRCPSPPPFHYTSTKTCQVVPATNEWLVVRICPGGVDSLTETAQAP